MEEGAKPRDLEDRNVSVCRISTNIPLNRYQGVSAMLRTFLSIISKSE